MSINILYPNFTDIFIVTLENKPQPVPTLMGFLTSALHRESMPSEFPRASGLLLHHGMTNQIARVRKHPSHRSRRANRKGRGRFKGTNGQGQVLGGQAPSDSSRLGAKQGHL